LFAWATTPFLLLVGITEPFTNPEILKALQETLVIPHVSRQVLDQILRTNLATKFRLTGALDETDTISVDAEVVHVKANGTEFIIGGRNDGGLLSRVSADASSLASSLELIPTLKSLVAKHTERGGAKSSRGKGKSREQGEDLDSDQANRESQAAERALVAKALLDLCGIPCRLRRQQEKNGDMVYWTVLTGGEGSTGGGRQKSEVVVWNDRPGKEAPIELEDPSIFLEGQQLTPSSFRLTLREHGPFGAVYEASGKVMARSNMLLKAVKCDTVGPQQLIEAKIICQMRHPNLAPYRDCFVGLVGNDMSVCLLMDRYDVTLQETIERAAERHLPLALQGILLLAHDLAAALEYLHSRNPAISHQNLKPSNIFMTNSARSGPTVRVADFGYGPLLGRSQFGRSSSACDQYYLAPEYRRCAKGQTEGAQEHRLQLGDVYSFGAILGQVMTLDKEPRVKSPLLEMADFTSDVPNPEWLCELVLRCVSEDHTGRPTFPEIQRLIRDKTLEDQLRDQLRF